MHCPMCDADNGEVAAIVARGYRCTSCGAWPNSTWWYRAERRRDLDLGETFGEYRILRSLGTDDHSTTCVAERLDDGRRVTLVAYRPWFSEDPEFVARFASATAWQAHLADTQVVAVDRAGKVGDMYFVATEPRAAEPLAAWLGRSLEWPCALAILARLCELLGIAHQLGFVAGLNPAHIQVELRPRPPVMVRDPYRTTPPPQLEVASVRLDVYGIALIRNWTIGETDTRMIAGALDAHELMSPEAIMGKPCDGRSDVYVLGLLGYHLLSGSRAFPDARGAAARITAQLKQRVPPPSQRAPHVPPAVDALIARCLEKDRQLRFATVAELAETIVQLSA